MPIATRELPPLECDYRGLHIVSAPPPSSGGIVLCEMLHILEGYPLREYGYGSARAVHVQIEAMRHAYVDRNHLLGDPTFVQNPMAQLLDKNYAAGFARADRSATRRQFAAAPAGHRVARRHGTPRTTPSPTATATPWP